MKKLVFALALLFALPAYGADTQVTTGIQTSLDEFGPGVYGPYWGGTLKGVIVFVDDGSDILFARTTNAGTNWSVTEIQSDSTEQIAVWYDKETSGDSGTKVHIAWADSVADEASRN